MVLDIRLTRRKSVGTEKDKYEINYVGTRQTNRITRRVVSNTLNTVLFYKRVGFIMTCKISYLNTSGLFSQKIV